MKIIGIILAYAMMCGVFAQQNPDSINFDYVIMPSEMGESFLTARGDTVCFGVYYVDSDCGAGYTYRFEKKDRELILIRTLPEGHVCSREDDLLYGVEGTLSNVGKGIYAFTLASETGAGIERMFSEPVQVK